MESEYKIEVLEETPKGGQQSGRIPIGVKVTHVASGLTASCEFERSQYKNREIAIRMIMRGREILDI